MRRKLGGGAAKSGGPRTKKRRERNLFMGCGNEGLDRDLQDEWKIGCGASLR
jgi:hypothetical protein